MNYKLLRNLHLAFGLLALPFLLMYAVSAVQMAHIRGPLMRPSVTERTISLPRGIDDGNQLARLLVNDHGLRGELRNVKALEAQWEMRFQSPGTVHDVRYAKSDGTTSIKTSVGSFLGMLNRLHHAAGVRWPAYMPLRLWGAAIGIVSIAAIGLAVSGLWMWWLRRQDRIPGLILVTANVLFALVVLALMRSAGP